MLRTRRDFFLKMKTDGKIIAIVGAQASGKSTLVRNLTKVRPEFKGFYEGENFPKFVTDAFVSNEFRLRSFIYFHNHWIKQYIEAETQYKKGLVCLLDTFWLTNLFYLDTLKDKNDQLLIFDLIRSTAQLFPPPHGIIFLNDDITIMEKRIYNRSRQGNRDWEKRSQWLSEPMMVKQRHEDLFQEKINFDVFVKYSKVIELKSSSPHLIDKSLEFIDDC